ncbi:DUF3429 domain-containing protein [uncultured Umboniibacter sp.]|uniref:DUF3429 domain-containing protein n=1 Tax=uncultured Umboniibacter sp. TaxID=1798917 RepID=UPI00260B5C6D|nr:DUF3429 domain-containing protein [uncultured Umboniibacter sp.]
MKHEHTIRLLTTFGTVPFIAAAIAEFVGISLFGHTPVEIFSSYGTVIISFLAGSIWGAARYQNTTDNQAADTPSKAPFVATNVLTLVCWFALLQSSFVFALGVNGLLFIALYRVEATRERDGSYRRLRRVVTTLVVLLHLIMVVILWLV